MAGRQAKIISFDDLNDLLVFADCSRNPARNRVIVLLSAKAGLRAGEIANLTWDMVADAALSRSSIKLTSRSLSDASLASTTSGAGRCCQK